MHRIASVFAALLLAGSAVACTELLAAGAGAGAGYVVGSEVEESEHEDD